MSADPYYRARYLPGAIKRTERKLAALYAEFQGLPGDAICEDLDRLHEAWEHVVAKAQIDAEKQGRESSMGVDHA